MLSLRYGEAQSLFPDRESSSGMVHPKNKLLASGWLVVLVLVWLSPVTARASMRDAPRPANFAVAVSIAPAQLDALFGQAQTRGAVRVIVGLRANYQPEGRLRTAQAVQAQRTAIAQAQTTLLNQMSAHNIQTFRKFSVIPYVAMQVDASALAALATNPHVASVAQDRRRYPSLSESVPLIGAPTVWAQGYAGAGQAIAILDTGVDKAHPFLAGKVVSEACYSTTNPADTATSLCPGGVAQTTAPDSGVPCTVVGICIHGTHVAGIAAGKDPGTVGFSGVAKEADLIAIQVFSYFADCACIGAYDSDILAGMERVQTLKSTLDVAAINLSLGGETYTTQAECDATYPAYVDAIANLASVGVATIIAAGNDYSPNSLEVPGCVSGAVSVGSTQDGSFGTTVDAVSSFSNSTAFLSLLAPGQVITSSATGGGYLAMQGTSMAAPHVAGAWAVLKSAKPNATITQVLNTLTGTGKPVTDTRNGITKPRIQLDRAVPALWRTEIWFPEIFKDAFP